jgi:TolB-like protein
VAFSSNPDDSECDVAAVRAQVRRISESAAFRHSERRQNFLRYVVEEALAGRADRLKGYVIATEVFGRPSSFDPQIDPIVRIEAGRLRDKLHEYYAAEGRSDTIVIDLPKGSYVPAVKRAKKASPQEHEGDIPADGQETPPNTASSGLVSVTSTVESGIMQPGRAALVGGLICMLIGLWGLWNGALQRHGVLDRPSLAVLPFENIGDDSKWNRFADGLTEDIIADLAHSRDLIVIARSSTQRYKGLRTDAREVGRELGVKYVLEGSIQTVRERIRVTAKLIETTSGSHVWSQRYDRQAGDLFSVQNDVTQSIAAALGSYSGAVAEAERRQIRRKPPASLTAYDSYLLGVEAKHRVTKESLSEAEALLTKSIELDPQLARAYVALVDTYWYQIDLGLTGSVAETAGKMLAAGEKAVALDPADGRTRYALGLAALYNGKAEVAATEFKTAEALAPSDADTLLTIAWSLPGLGQSDHAVELAERALVLNPHYPDWYNQGLSYVYFFGGHYGKSIEYRLLVKQPSAIDYAYLAIAYAQLGQIEKTAEAADEVRRRSPSWIAEVYLSESGGYQDREADRFIEGARRAGLNACAPARAIVNNPSFIPVKSCTEWRAKLPG